MYDVWKPSNLLREFVDYASVAVGAPAAIAAVVGVVASVEHPTVPNIITTTVAGGIAWLSGYGLWRLHQTRQKHPAT